MLHKGIDKGGHYLVGHPILFGNTFYDLGYLGVMYVRYMGEKVMLYLVIETAYKPEHPMAAW